MTATFVRKFYDMEFTIPAEFEAGHVLSANEANFINSQKASVVGNQYSGDIRRAVAGLVAGGNKKATVADLGWDHAARFAEKFADYELGVSNRGSGGTTSGSNPLDRMVSFLASEDLKARIIRKGLKVATFYKAKSADGTQSKWSELLAANIEAKGEEFRAQAEAQLAALEATDTEADPLLDDVEVEAQPEAA
jgi:hypothetical protein